MKEKVVLKGTKEESVRMRWVQKALSKDPMRPALEGFNVKDGLVQATDGYRFHITQNVNGLSDYDNVILFGKIPAGDFITELETIDAQYPDLSTFALHDPATFEIIVNPKYLVEALQGFDGSVRMCFATSNQPMHILGTNKHNDPCYVVLMPMSKGQDEQSDWMPFTRKSVEEPEEDTE